MPRSEEKRVLSHAARVNLMKNIRGQARRGQEGLEAREREKRAREERGRENEKRREKERGEGGEEEKGRDRQKTHLAAKDRSPEGESASLLSLSSRLSKDVSSLLFSLFFSFLSLAFAPRRV